VEAKFEALKKLQALKTKSLMSTIDTLERENKKLKVLGKDSRRAQMVQALRAKLKDFELVIEVLKAEVAKRPNKEGEYLDAEQVAELVVRKTAGGTIYAWCYCVVSTAPSLLLCPSPFITHQIMIHNPSSSPLSLGWMD
jgi:hypothetical protein